MQHSKNSAFMTTQRRGWLPGAALPAQIQLYSECLFTLEPAFQKTKRMPNWICRDAYADVITPKLP